MGALRREVLLKMATVQKVSNNPKPNGQLLICDKADRDVNRESKALVHFQIGEKTLSAVWIAKSCQCYRLRQSRRREDSTRRR